MGYNVLLLDFRAHGASGGNTCTIGYYEAEDVKLAYNFLKDKGEKNIALWGISMGAAAIAHAVDEYHLQPSKVILEMPLAQLKKRLNPAFGLCTCLYSHLPHYSLFGEELKMVSGHLA
jgi:alpha-beta hydrolase superfamily lysophospholipase